MAYFLGKDVEVFLTLEQGGVADTVSGAYLQCEKASATISAVDAGSDIYFVYTHNWQSYGDGLLDFDLGTVSRVSSVKINYTHRF